MTEAVKVKARKKNVLHCIALQSTLQILAFVCARQKQATELLTFFPAGMWGPECYVTLTLLSSFIE
jgi:hypothetical protein